MGNVSTCMELENWMGWTGDHITKLSVIKKEKNMEKNKLNQLKVFLEKGSFWINSITFFWKYFISLNALVPGSAWTAHLGYRVGFVTLSLTSCHHLLVAVSTFLFLVPSSGWSSPFLAAFFFNPGHGALPVTGAVKYIWNVITFGIPPWSNTT